jgi:hypothetical protein
VLIAVAGILELRAALEKLEDQLVGLSAHCGAATWPMFVCAGLYEPGSKHRRVVDGVVVRENGPGQRERACRQTGRVRSECDAGESQAKRQGLTEGGAEVQGGQTIARWG